MTETIREVMTVHPVALEDSATALDAARAMRDRNIGDVIVMKGGRLRGIITDRDLVVRVLAEGKDPGKTRLEECCSKELVTLKPSQTTQDAVRIMKEKAVRRVPVVENGNVVGIVSLGDLATHLDRQSALGTVSAARPNR